MVEIVLSVAPVFLLIVFGFFLRRGGIPSIEFWNLNDKLVYWVLFPALFFHTTSTVDLSASRIGPYALVVVVGFFASFFLGLASGWGLRRGGPVTSSVLQGASRHNTFIALAVAERLMGAEGLALAALAAALLVPVTNVAVVTAMTLLVKRDGGGTGWQVARAIAWDLARNPLILSVAAGVVVNVAGIAPIPVVHDVANLLGRAALPVVLLCVGANLHVREMTGGVLPIATSSFIKLLVLPAAVATMVGMLGMTGIPALTLVLYTAVPTASSSYTLSRQLGGDAPLMAAIVSVQTLISFVTLPLAFMIAQKVFQ